MKLDNMFKKSQAISGKEPEKEFAYTEIVIKTKYNLAF